MNSLKNLHRRFFIAKARAMQINRIYFMFLLFNFRQINQRHTCLIVLESRQYIFFSKHLNNSSLQLTKSSRNSFPYPQVFIWLKAIQEDERVLLHICYSSITRVTEHSHERGEKTMICHSKCRVKRRESGNSLYLLTLQDDGKKTKY